MEERDACALLKRRFEAAGFHIEDDHSFDEDGVRFDIDGFDPERRVGFEYTSSEAGDGWDVDDDVKTALAARMERDELYVLVIDEADARDAATLEARASAFLDELKRRGVTAEAPASKPAKPPPPPKPKPAAKAKPKPKAKPASKRSR